MNKGGNSRKQRCHMWYVQGTEKYGVEILKFVWSWRIMLQKVWNKDGNKLCSLIAMGFENLKVVWTWPWQVIRIYGWCGTEKQQSKSGILGRVPWQGRRRNRFCDPSSCNSVFSHRDLPLSFVDTKNWDSAAWWKTSISYFQSGLHPGGASNIKYKCHTRSNAHFLTFCEFV